MADADDPWANHVRGTPLAEGKDPLTTQNWSATDDERHKTQEDKPSEATTSTTADNGDASPSPASGSTTEDARIDASQSKDSGSAVIANGPTHAPDVSPPAESDVGQEANGVLHQDVNGEAEESQPGAPEYDEEDDDDEEFVYPGSSSQTTEAQAASSSTETQNAKDAAPDVKALDDAPQLRQASTSQEPDPVERTTHYVEPLPVDYARLGHLCSQGPLSALQSFFSVTTSLPPAGSGMSAFALANEPNPSTGLVPIQYAAREGRTDVLKWLINEAGSLVEMEDREGETALHKAAMTGKLPALTFLIASGASANCLDGDGWTPLHNACSKGYLDIVKVLIENAGASVDVKGGRGGWTPLMNAASNGHLPIVRYLTAKQHVDPFVRNAAGETAYDVAAATFEIFICEILEKYESERWAALKFSSSAANTSVPSGEEGQQRRIVIGQGPYNPLILHTTVPIVVHENQRLDTRLSTLAIRGGKPRWSGTQAGRPDKPDRRAPGTMPPGPLSLSRTRNLPMSRENVKLPTRQQPYKLQLPNRAAQIAAARRARGEIGNADEEELGTTPTPDSVLTAAVQQRRQDGSGVDRAESAGSSEPSHFWLSDWQIDLTHAQVDVDQGWQYSQSFDTPEERWTASAPAPLVRLLEGRGLGSSVQRAVSNVVLASTGAAPVSEAEAVASGWVRRRRWVRVMRRRLDIEFGDDLEAIEQESLDAIAASRLSLTNGLSSSTNGDARPSITSSAQAQAREEADALGSDADYLARSKAIAGSDVGATPADMEETEIQRRIARVELAVAELRQHAFGDQDADRQQRAEELLKEYMLQLGQLRQAAGLDEESEDEDDDDDDDEFIYPNSYKDGGQSVITRIGGPFTTSSGVVPSKPSIANRQSSTTSVFGERAAPSEAGTSLGAIRSADLANARDFRVPTHETPSHLLFAASNGGALREHNLMPTWEHDQDVTTCRGCNRRFTFFLRKHHCRRCGRIHCDSCSTHRTQLAPDELVIDPGVPEMMMEVHGLSRICDSCDAERRLPSSLRNARGPEALVNGGMMDSLSRSSSTNVGDESDDRLSDVSSRASELTECPVCARTLATIGDSAIQEEHVRLCLENGGGGSVQGGRYLVYRLGEGPIVGKECQICLEDLLVGMTIARLPCLCYYHRHCIDSWFSRGRSCPVHARVW